MSILMMTKDSPACPCGSTNEYQACCFPCISGSRPAATPESLMRSRFTAFSLKDPGYLVKTLDPEQLAAFGGEIPLLAQLTQTMAVTDWLGLKVLGSGQEGPDRGWVEFAAFFSRDGKLGQLHEKSAFIKKQGLWYYKDGDILPNISLGRNQPCFCGSGKKFKHCHGPGEWL